MSVSTALIINYKNPNAESCALLATLQKLSSRCHHQQLVFVYIQLVSARVGSNGPNAPKTRPASPARVKKWETGTCARGQLGSSERGSSASSLRGWLSRASLPLDSQLRLVRLPWLLPCHVVGVGEVLKSPLGSDAGDTSVASLQNKWSAHTTYRLGQSQLFAASVKFCLILENK